VDDTSAWAQHRPRVVAAVAAAVRGVDPEEAASRALVKMLRLAGDGVTFESPLAYWRRAAVNEGYSLTREAERSRPVDDDVLGALAPAVPDAAALEAERQADIDMLRRALDGLTGADRDLLWSRHVDERSVTAIAEALAVRPHAVTVRLRRAEERLAGGFAAAHAALTDEADCRAARSGMHGYLKGRLSARRRRELEQHVDGCAACTRAFIDVREVSWGLKAIAPWLGAGALKGAAVLAGTAGGTGAGGAAGARGARRGRGTTTAAVAGGVLVVAAGLASAMALGPDGGPARPATTPTTVVAAADGERSGAAGGDTQPLDPSAASPTASAAGTVSPSGAPGPGAPAADAGPPFPADAPPLADDGPVQAASRGDDTGRTTAPTPAPAAAGSSAPATAPRPQSGPPSPRTPDPSPSSPVPSSSSTPVPSSPPSPATPAAPPGAPASSAPTTAPATQTFTAELPVRGVGPGLYRVAATDGVTITRVRAPHADTWVYRWVDDRWYVQVWRTASPHVVTVTFTGPAGSSVWLRPA